MMLHYDGLDEQASFGFQRLFIHNDKSDFKA